MNNEAVEEIDSTEVIAASQDETIIHITENGVEGLELLCRLCANKSDHLIPIYSEEGVSNDLAEKMNLYLPIKVAKNDVLPLQCCFNCATTVLNWHEFVVGSVEADRRFKIVQEEAEKEPAIEEAELEITADAGTSQEEPEETFDTEEDRPSIMSDNLSQYRQTPVFSQIVPKKSRGRKKAQLKFENTLSTDGEWIKTELVLDSEVNPFIASCELTEEQNFNPDNNSDFDEDLGTFQEEQNKVHECQHCEKVFERLTEFNEHFKSCSVAGNGQNLLKIEEDSLNSNDEFMEVKKCKRDYRCNYCNFMTPRKDDLFKHVQETHPDNFESFNEKRQRKRSKIDQETVNRAKVIVDSRTYYNCKICGKNLHSPYTFIWHTRIHTGERPYVCDLCGKQFRVSQGLVRHLRDTHAGIKNFPCDLCGRMFATRRNVEEHRRIHTNERPYICDLCGKAFKQKASLFVHNRSHSDVFPFKCSYCNQAFRTKPPLLVHVTRHTGEKPHACDICGRCFRIKYELKRHRLIHSDDKPFSCAECGLSFRQKRYLRNHNKINHNRTTP